MSDRGSVRRDSVRAAFWSADGTIKVTGPVEVGTASVRGTVSLGRGLSADSFRARGDLEVEAMVGVRGTLSVGGTARFAGEVHASDLTVDGTARFGAHLVVDRTLSVHGSIHAPSLRAGVVELSGAATVPGKVEVLRLDAVLRRATRLGNLIGEGVRIRGRVPNLVDRVLFHEAPCHVDRIEADRVELEAVDVEFVRARTVVLGRETHVTSVEGTIVRKHPTSSVGPRSKSPPPYGLRR